MSKRGTNRLHACGRWLGLLLALHDAASSDMASCHKQDADMSVLAVKQGLPAEGKLPTIVCGQDEDIPFIINLHDLVLIPMLQTRPLAEQDTLLVVTQRSLPTSFGGPTSI
jgi:hypothetical protein